MSESAKLKVLHINTEMTWRGGENQLRLLLEGGRQDANWFLAAPARSEAFKRLAALVSGFPLEREFWRWMPALPKLISFCRNHKIQIIDCQSSKAHSVGLMLKRYLPELKLVVHRRVDFPPASDWFSRRKYLSRRVDAYVAISQAIAEILLAAGVSKDKVYVVRSAVDPSPFQAINQQTAKKSVCQELGLDPSTTLICNVAYHTPQKEQATLIKAMAELKKQNLNCHALLAGEGPLTGELKALAIQLEVMPMISFLGIRQDIPRLLAASEIFAMPSRYEGLGTSILDAIYSGCAVAASSVGGIPEMIRHQETGLLSEAGDYLSFAGNLKTLICNPSLSQQLNQAALQHVTSLFSLEQMVEGNLGVYRRLLS